jgi:ABC-type transport system involved in cytochrome c biogenesis permease subunit
MCRMKWIPIPTAVLTFLLTAGPVLAQNASKAPTPKDAMSKPWASIVVAFFLMILIAVPSFLNAKRGHQD